MLIHKTSKEIIQRQEEPNNNWLSESEKNYYFLVPDNTDLYFKIKEHYPYFDFMLDDGGGLIDVTPTQRPTPEPTPPTVEERLAASESALLGLMGG